jgi:hypothetical protein
MNSHIDLSFPEIKAKVKLDSKIDLKFVQDGLNATRKFQAEKNAMKV